MPWYHPLSLGLKKQRFGISHSFLSSSRNLSHSNLVTLSGRGHGEAVFEAGHSCHLSVPGEWPWLVPRGELPTGEQSQLEGVGGKGAQLLPCV